MIVPEKAAALTVIGAMATAVPQPLVTVYEIVAAPALTPDTSPAVPTVATLTSLLLQVPPGAAFVNVTGDPMQMPDGPTIVPASGDRLTVTDAVLKQLPIV